MVTRPYSELVPEPIERINSSISSSDSEESIPSRSIALNRGLLVPHPRVEKVGIRNLPSPSTDAEDVG